MDRAKAAVESLLSRDGRHDTTVHEVINPAVEHETVIRSERDETQTAIDREVHQDHYHTSVQPVRAREVLPEKHIEHVAEIENRSYQHGNPEHVKQRLAAEREQFKNTKTVSEVQRTEAINPTIAGEHVHHHVHESIQPILQKETIQPSVVHTTIPIHEVHQNEPKHHTATQLPAVSLEDFKRQGGALGGREEHTDAFEGEPKSVGGTLGGARASGTTSLTESESYGGVGTSAVGATSGSAFGADTAGGTAGTSGTTGTTYSTSERSRGGSDSNNKRHGFIDKLKPMKGGMDTHPRVGISH